MAALKGKTLFITGATRGIGEAIALRAAADGANVVVAAKTVEPHPHLAGTLYTAVQKIEAAGGRALPLQVDVRFEDQIATAVSYAIATFGGIDILVNNASVLSLTPTLQTPMKRFDLMFSVNVRATFACSQACLPHLILSKNPHILNLAPPLTMKAEWFKDHCAYSMSKYGMSMCVLGMAEEFRSAGVAVNALWPRTVIATAALRMLVGRVSETQCRTPSIVADAAYLIVTRDSRTCTGNFFIDEEVLRMAGVTDFQKYAVSPGAPLLDDLFLG
jgi:Dehydrogenases with different specificities (related to short-chain alcohol dehydrogenases)